MARDLVLIMQNNGTNSCGQCCVCMVSNRLLTDVVEVVGKTGRTTFKDLARALKQFNIECDEEPRKAGRPPIPVQRAIVRIGSKGEEKLSHFVVWSSGAWYDPFCGFSDKQYHHKWPKEIYPIQFIEIKTL